MFVLLVSDVCAAGPAGSVIEAVARRMVLSYVAHGLQDHKKERSASWHRSKQSDIRNYVANGHHPAGQILPELPNSQENNPTCHDDERLARLQLSDSLTRVHAENAKFAMQR